jgi:FAD/FMN-containing dehydrogenase
VLPLERGRAVHCEFDLHCDLEDAQETRKVKSLWLKASEALINRGAYFDRPYGVWAEMVYKRAGNYTNKLMQLKKELDPQGVLNPGKLCF